MVFRKLIKWWQSLWYYVIADPTDNSITLSKKLFFHIMKNANDKNETKVFVFRELGSDDYGFMINPNFDQPTQLCEIQYNEKYHCIGFETLCPSVGQIFYSYGLPAYKKVKMSVSIRRTIADKVYYIIEKPNEKYIRQYSQS
jgi:hypothetical protein